MCKTIKKSNRGYSEIKASYNNQRMSKFAGMVNFISIFCPKLQKLLKPIYDLTRKGKQFLWEEEQQKAFDEIKCRLQRPPVLHLPDRHGHFNCIQTLVSLPLVVCTVSNSKWTAKAHCICQ